MTDAAFHFVEPPMLSALELLGTPAAIISLDTARPVWANASALAYWNAESLDHLLLHMTLELRFAIAGLFDPAEPALMPGEQRTIVLRDDTQRAVGAAAVTCTGVSLEGHPKAVLVEFHRYNLANEPAREPHQKPLMFAATASGGLTGTQSSCDPIIAQAAGDLLSATEAALKTVLTICPIPALVTSTGNAMVLHANPAARQLLAIADTYVGADIAWFASARDRRIFFEGVDRYGSFSEIIPLIARSGRTFMGALSGQRMEVDGRAMILVMIQDVDGLQRASGELETALGIERALIRRQLRMLEIASHEFRTPLAVIDGAAQRIVRGANSDAPAQVRELAERIREYVRRMGSLLDNTIDRVRNSASKSDIRLQPDRLQRSIAQVAMMFEESADIELAEEIGDLPEIWFDRVLIEQVLVNLVENAVKYSPGRARIHILAEANEHHVELLVRDRGIGIMPDEREHVFAERARGKNVGSFSGTGLGLYIVDAIVRAHGGEVSVADTDGPGATLKVVLPLRPRDAQHA